MFLSYPQPVEGELATPNPESTLAGHWKKAIGAPPTYQGIDDDYHTISSQVFRMEICFQMKPHSRPSEEPAYSNTPYHSTSLATNGLQDVASIVVAIAILDTNSRQRVRNLEPFVAMLPDPTDQNLQASPPQLMAELWREKLSTMSSGSSPAPSIRIYQRVFDLNFR